MFRHGIKVSEPLTGARTLAAVATTVIGLVCTASTDEGVEATAALDAAFPENEPVLVTDIRDAIGKAGNGGTLKPALEAIADQTTPIMVVVRVPVGADEEEQETNTIGGIVDGKFTGIEALLAAETQLGVRPRILGAPGLDFQLEVKNALVTAAQALRGFVYAQAIGDLDQAILHRADFAAREIMLIWPDFNTGDVFPGDAVSRALGLRAKIDEQVGWHKTLSNVAINGGTSLTRDVHFDLQDPSTTAGTANAADITTIVRQNGFRFWGNRTCSDEPTWAFESRVRTSQALQDTIAGGLAWAIDKPLTPGLVRDIVETISAEFRRLVAEGKLIGAEVLPLDTDLNTPAYLASGRLAIDYEFTDVAPLENLNLNQRVTDRFYADFNQQIAAAN